MRERLKANINDFESFEQINSYDSPEEQPFYRDIVSNAGSGLIYPWRMDTRYIEYNSPMPQEAQRNLYASKTYAAMLETIFPGKKFSVREEKWSHEFETHKFGDTVMNWYTTWIPLDTEVIEKLARGLVDLQEDIDIESLLRKDSDGHVVGLTSIEDLVVAIYQARRGARLALLRPASPEATKGFEGQAQDQSEQSRWKPEIMAQLRQAVLGLPPHSIVLLGGPSASGKSTIRQEIEKILSDQNRKIVSVQDGFPVGKADRQETVFPGYGKTVRFFLFFIFLILTLFH